MIEWNSAALAVGLCPSFGGGIAYLDAWHDGARLSLMRPLRAPAMSADAFEPNRLACYPLVPWSNRIDHGGFAMDGARVALAPNRNDADLQGSAVPHQGTGMQAYEVILQAYRHYFRFADYLFANGFDVMVYDYRGIGESRPDSLRGFKASDSACVLRNCAA